MLPRSLIAAAVLALFSLPLAAQQDDMRRGQRDVMTAQDRGVFFYLHGGPGSALEDLNEAGTADFDTGYNLGGGIGVNLHRYLALRGDFTFIRNETAAPGTAFNEENFNRFVYGGDLILKAPVARNRVLPYVFGGFAGITVDPDFDLTGIEIGPERFTNPAGRFGAGVQVRMPGTNLGLFAQGTGLVYEFDEYGFDETQTDILVSLGASYSLPLNWQ